MNERHGGILGGLIGFFTDVFRKLDEMIDWTYLLNSGMNAAVGATVAFIVTHYLRKAYGVNKKDPKNQ